MNINRDYYLRMVEEFRVPELSAVVNMQQVIFQQDGALEHYSHEICAFQHEQSQTWLVGLPSSFLRSRYGANGNLGLRRESN